MKISEREQLISEISTQYNIKGYDYAPLERDKIIEFISRLNELQRKQRLEFEKLQVRLKLYLRDVKGNKHLPSRTTAERKTRIIIRKLKNYPLKSKA